MSDTGALARTKQELISKRKSLDNQLDNSIDKQIEILNAQIVIQKEQTKHEIREQQEKIASMKADICEDAGEIGLKILRHVLSDNKVPTDAFKGAKGVLLLQAAFAAAGVTGARGGGFVVVNNGGAWSAPAFVRLSTVGLGFSLGGEMVDTIAVLYRDEDVESYREGHFGIQPYRADLHIPVTHGVGEKEAHPAVFSSHSGAMIDFSVSSGGITFDAAANTKKYGAHVTPAGILCGEVDAPADMDTFYEELSALSLFAAPHIDP